MSQQVGGRGEDPGKQRQVKKKGAGRPECPWHTVDDILLLHHLLLMLLQEAAVHSKAPRICLKVLLVHLKVAHQLVVERFYTCVCISAGNTSEPSSPVPTSSSSPSRASHITVLPTCFSPRPGLLTFINKGFHRQGSVPHVEGVCGLGEDLTQPQRRLIIEMSEGSGGHLHHPNSGTRSLPRLGPKVGLLGIATLCWNLSFLYLPPALNSGQEIALLWALHSPARPPLPHIEAHPAMLVVETLLAKDKEERPRREPRRDCRKLSEG